VYLFQVRRKKTVILEMYVSQVNVSRDPRQPGAFSVQEGTTTERSRTYFEYRDYRFFSVQTSVREEKD